MADKESMSNFQRLQSNATGTHSQLTVSMGSIAIQLAIPAKPGDCEQPRPHCSRIPPAQNVAKTLGCFFP
eukprot:761232-Hanusia_phi.AAC.5